LVKLAFLSAGAPRHGRVFTKQWRSIADEFGFGWELDFLEWKSNAYDDYDFGRYDWCIWIGCFERVFEFMEQIKGPKHAALWVGTDILQHQDMVSRGHPDPFAAARIHLADASNLQEEAKQRGYTMTLFGRRRYLPELKSPNPMLRAQAERIAINMPIQGLEADIMKKAMIGVDNWIQKENLNNNVKMLLQVHDELLFEVKEDLVKKIAPEIVKIMESVIKLSVPIAAEAKIGNNWGELRVFPKRNA